MARCRQNAHQYAQRKKKELEEWKRKNAAKRKSPPPPAKRKITPADPEWTTVKRPKQPIYRREIMATANGQVQVILSKEEWIDPRLGGDLDPISARVYTALMEEHPPAPSQEL